MKTALIKTCLLIFLVISSRALFAENVVITVSDTIYNTINADFFGIQYHSNTYNNKNATDKLDLLHLQRIRVWANINKFHPNPDTWNWEELDRNVEEILNSGYKFILCLYQSEEWFIGSPDKPWWKYPEALTEWENAAYQLADRYKNNIDMIIIFDEPNMMHQDKAYYITFKECAQLYIKAAQKIKEVNPDILCGGPSAFGGWENGHWAKYVLNEPDGTKFLDFVSCNIFLSWDANDSDDTIMDRTIWYEEAPQKIEKMLGDKCPSTLILDAYNASALWKKDGKLWTDPRNVSAFGGVYLAAALLHSAKGKFNVTLHWETIGGFGILDWYPQFKELAPYYTWKYLIDTAGLADGAQIRGCTTTESPKENAPHQGGMNVNLYRIQPFAVRRTDGGISVILINKYSIDTITAAVNVPDGMTRFAIYRYDKTRVTDCFLPLEKDFAKQTVELNCPPYSVSIIRFETDSPVGINEDSGSLSEGCEFLQNYPNPFNSSTNIEYSLSKSSHVQMIVYNLLGREVRLLVNEQQKAGKHKIVWDGRDELGNLLNSGIYTIRMNADHEIHSKKIVYLK